MLCTSFFFKKIYEWMLIIVEWNEDGIEPGLNLNRAPILFYFILAGEDSRTENFTNPK